MAQQSSVVSDAAASRARGIALYINRCENLYARRELSRTDLHRTYAGAYLSFYTYVERSIERLFLGLLVDRYVMSQADVRPLVTVRSDKVARNIVSGERSYADWIPYDLTRRRAKAFLSGGRPFSSTGSTDRKVFERMSLVRNAIAHDSAHALKIFRSEFVDGRALPPEQHKPPGYLRGQHAVNQTRLDYMFAEAVAVLGRLCA